ncbi:hypothetical protein L1887_28642 [Cichorium endivia]|nr:hypothetical protein L1887_28642 [Cichorium endivia]
MVHIQLQYQLIATGITKGFYRGWSLVSSQTVTLKQLGFPNEVGVPGSLIKEITTLLQIKHPNIIELMEVVNSKEQTSLMLVYEFMDTSLTSFMRIHPKVMKNPQTIKGLLRQILLAVYHFHSFNIVHEGIKPKNMFIDPATNTLKITDFIWPRSISNSIIEDPYEESTFYYKAPEILVDKKQVTTAVDVWSVGCVFAEMVTRKPLFPAKTEFNQLAKIFSIMGTPSEETWPGISGIYPYLHVYSNCKPKDLRKLVPGLEPAGIDLLNKLLYMDPKKRIPAIKALEHEYFQN